MLRTVAGVIGLLAILVYGVLFSERPPNLTEPNTLAGDGSLINYCDLPEVSGEGLHAQEGAHLRRGRRGGGARTAPM